MDAFGERLALELTRDEAAALRRVAAREGVAPETLLRRSLREHLTLRERRAGEGAGGAPETLVARMFE